MPPLPFRVVITGASVASASAVSACRAPWVAMPPPARITRRPAREIRAAASASAVGSGATGAGTARRGGTAMVVAYCRSMGTSITPGWGRPLRIDSTTPLSMGPISCTCRGEATVRATVSSIGF